MQTLQEKLSAELAQQERRVEAVHARLAAQAGTALSSIMGGPGSSKFTVSSFMQHCVLPRVTYSPQVNTTTLVLTGWLF